MCVCVYIYIYIYISTYTYTCTYAYFCASPKRHRALRQRLLRDLAEALAAHYIHVYIYIYTQRIVTGSG